MFTYQKYKSYDTKIYRKSLALRNELLRKPFGKSIYEENLSVEKDNDFYGIFAGEQLIATLSFFEKEPGSAQLTAFAVKEEFQRQGLGQNLVTFLVADLRVRGYHRVLVADRATAKDFYQKCGFQIINGPILNQQLGVADYEMVYEI